MPAFIPEIYARRNNPPPAEPTGEMWRPKSLTTASALSKIGRTDPKPEKEKSNAGHRRHEPWFAHDSAEQSDARSR